jgi:serine/threonine-protein kinase
MDRYCPKCFRNFPSSVESCPDDGARLVSFADGDLVGQKLDDRYKVISRIGKGGMGVVYRAEQPMIGRIVALKVLNKDIVKDDTALKRFLNEARAMASLKSPHTVTLYDFGSTSTGLLYYTMELLEGQPLSRLLRRAGTLGYERAAKLILQACDSLEEAHDKMILHRDIKPDNLFVTTDEKKGTEFLKVLDFGIAKLMGDSSMGTLTKTGMVCGTPDYLSPEQVMGQDIGPASDLYSLGIVFYEMLAGRPPFRASTTMKVLMMHLNEPPPPLSVHNPQIEVPKSVQEFIEIALAKKHQERFNTVAEFRRALNNAVAEYLANPQTATLPPLTSTGDGMRVITSPYAEGKPGAKEQATLPAQASEDLARITPPRQSGAQAAGRTTAERTPTGEDRAGGLTEDLQEMASAGRHGKKIAAVAIAAALLATLVILAATGVLFGRKDEPGTAAAPAPVAVPSPDPGPAAPAGASVAGGPNDTAAAAGAAPSPSPGDGVAASAPAAAGSAAPPSSETAGKAELRSILFTVAKELGKLDAGIEQVRSWDGDAATEEGRTALKKRVALLTERCDAVEKEMDSRTVAESRRAYEGLLADQKSAGGELSELRQRAQARVEARAALATALPGLEDRVRNLDSRVADLRGRAGQGSEAGKKCAQAEQKLNDVRQALAEGGRALAAGELEKARASAEGASGGLALIEQELKAAEKGLVEKEKKSGLLARADSCAGKLKSAREKLDAAQKRCSKDKHWGPKITEMIGRADKLQATVADLKKRIAGDANEAAQAELTMAEHDLALLDSDSRTVQQQVCKEPPDDKKGDEPKLDPSNRIKPIN